MCVRFDTCAGMDVEWRPVRKRGVCLRLCLCLCLRLHLRLCLCVYMPFKIVYTGRRKPIGSPKLQIIFHKRATKYRSLLQKMTY